MELRHLRYFCAVAEHLSFTNAARQLNVSQSGVSGQVRALENEIGVRLLRRTQREVTLTAEGSAFWQEARDILTRADRAVEVALKASHGESGQLIVGLCGPVTSLFLPKLRRGFRKQFPGAVLSVKERAPSEQVNALLNHEIDISFCRSVPREMKHLVHCELLFREPVIAAIPSSHPLAEQASIGLAQLAAERIILYDREGAPEIFDTIVTMCKKARFSPKVADTPRYWQSVLTMVEAGEGIALVPACVQQLHVRDVTFRKLRSGGCCLDAIVAWRRNEPNVLQESFLALLRAKRAEK